MIKLFILKKMESKIMSIMSLNGDCQRGIFKFFEVNDLCRSAQVSKEFYQISKDELLWKDHLEKQRPLLSKIYRSEMEKMSSREAYASLYTLEKNNWATKRFTKRSLYHPDANLPRAIFSNENVYWRVLATPSLIHVQDKKDRSFSQIKINLGGVAVTTLADDYFAFSNDRGDFSLCNLQKKTALDLGHLSGDWKAVCIKIVKEILCMGTVSGRIVFSNIRDQNTTMAISDAHKYKVNVIQPSVNGHRVFSGSDDATIISWDIDQSTKISQFAKHRFPVVSLTSLDENCFASGSVDDTIKIWDERSPSSSITLYGHEGTVDHLIFNGDDLISGGSDRTVRLWDLRKGESQILIRDQERITCLHSDSQKVVAGSYNGNLHVASPQFKFPTYKIDERMVTTTGLSADAKTVTALFSDGELMKYDFSAEQGLCRFFSSEDNL